MKKMNMEDRFSFGTLNKQKVDQFVQKGSIMCKKKKFLEDEQLYGLENE